MTAPATAYIDPQTGAVGDPFAPFLTPGASYIDPVTGQAIQGAATAPVGTPYYQSSQLVQGANGATASATGTEANQFEGFVDANGGGFGAVQDDPIRDLSMDAVSNDPSRVAAGLNSDNPDVQQLAMDNLFELGSGGVATATNGAAKTNLLTPDFLASLSPDVRAQVTATATAQGDINPGVQRVDGGTGPGGTFAALPGSPEDIAMQKANAAAAAAEAANPTPPPPVVDADPFGQFDSAQNPTHGVITPQYEAALAAQAQTNLLASTQPGAVAPAAGASATVSSAPVTTPVSAPASASAIAAPPAAPAATAGAPQVAPIVSPSTINPADPFAPFIDPTTGLPSTAASPPGATPINAPTFSPATASY